MDVSERQKGPKMLTGKIQWFDQGTGYGFIRPDESGGDVFFHQSAFQTSSHPIQKGDDLSFKANATERGPAATLITVAPKPRHLT